MAKWLERCVDMFAAGESASDAIVILWDVYEQTGRVGYHNPSFPHFPKLRAAKQKNVKN